ncbi:MAG: PfkB family carbohydrate kinase [Oceanicaulis sp.]
MTILFFGGHTFDMVYALNALPAENAKAKAARVYTAAGGPALNAAITCAILGGEAVYAGALGAGPLTDAVTAEAAQYGVRLHPIGAPTGDAPCASVALTPGGGRTIWSPPQTESPERWRESLPDPADFDALLIDGQLPEAATGIARAFRDAGKPVLLDAGSWKPGMDALTRLATETIASSAFAIRDESEVIAALLARGASLAAVTADAGPIVWKGADGRSGSVRPPQVEAVDTLAAGDVFHGAYAYFRFAAGRDVEPALEAAARVAASSVAYEGPRAGVRAMRD